MKSYFFRYRIDSISKTKLKWIFNVRKWSDNQSKQDLSFVVLHFVCFQIAIFEHAIHRRIWLIRCETKKESHVKCMNQGMIAIENVRYVRFSLSLSHNVDTSTRQSLHVIRAMDMSYVLVDYVNIILSQPHINAWITEFT